MPTFSSNNPGNYTYTVPVGAKNVSFSIAGGGGGGSKPVGGEWNVGEGGQGRAGNFSIAERTYAYNLTFYVGGRGSDGLNNSGGGVGSGGAGGSSTIGASGGSGHRSGGGGGGATAAYDSSLNKYIAWCGGGGGAGRFHPTTGINGIGTAGAGIGGGRSSLRGAPSWKTGGSAPAGHRGGGGGGSVSGVFGSNGGISTSGGNSGTGGNSGWYDQGDIGWITNSGYGNQGNGWFLLTYTDAPPSITFFGFKNADGGTQDDINILEGESVILTYTLDSNRSMNSVSIDQGLGSYSTTLTTNNITLTPAQTTTYTLTVSGPGGTVSDTTSVTVYVKPVITASITPPTINYGSQATLQWTTSGDASTMNIQPFPGSTTLNGTLVIQPTINTTYTLTASGLGGSDSENVSITVLQPPAASLDVSATVGYGSPVLLNYEVANATTDVKIFVSYRYRDDIAYSSYQEIFTFPGANAHSGNESHLPAYNDLGPYQVRYKLQGTGANNLNAVVEKIINVDIDVTPDIIDIPASRDLNINASPVVSPDDDLGTDGLLVDDIDIPVEITSDYPIQVQIDDGTYQNIRETGT